jgi:hypothetical protein
MDSSLNEPREVVVVDVQIPFWDLVQLMIKWALAAVPALIILWIIGAVVSMVLIGVFGGFVGFP